MDIIKKIKEQNIKLILLQFTDIHGSIKSVTIPSHKLHEALDKGVWFDGSSIQGFTRICESDMILVPDQSTFAVISWGTSDYKIGRFICDIYTPEGKPFEGDPRNILKLAIKEASEFGYIFNVGPELEFYLFRGINTEPILHDHAGYFDFSPRDLASRVRREIIFSLESMGLEIEASHHEVGPGQHEIDFKYADALKTADNCLTFKHCVKSIAHKNELFASFMPKPMFEKAGSGMHTHQSLFKNSNNVFYDPEDSYRLSKTAKSFIAGQIKHIKAMTAILSPTVNSYKRLVPGYEAPVYICWAQINRSALIRIPRFSQGREEATRIELRSPDPSCNPYLAFAVMLKAGLDGIKNNLTLPEPIEEDVYHFNEEQLKNVDTLPSSLGEAIYELKKDKVIQEALGKHAYSKYIDAKTKEYKEYQRQVTKWEMDKYFEAT